MFKVLMEPEVRRAWNQGEEAILLAYRRVWDQKPLLRRIYRDWWRRIEAWLAPGRTLEIGAGIGEFRRHVDVPCVSIDVVPGAGADVLADGQALPFRSASFANVVCIDVLHHLAAPETFFDEAARVLAARGRLVCVEPYVSPFAGLVRRLFHHETSEFHHAPSGALKREALTGEPRLPTRLFFGERASFPKHGMFRLEERELHSMFLYPLSGGFSYRQLLPDMLVPWVSALERLGALRRLCALKMLVILERLDDSEPPEPRGRSERS